MKSLATNEKCCRTRRSGRLDEGLVQLRLAFDIAADSVEPEAFSSASSTRNVHQQLGGVVRVLDDTINVVADDIIGQFMIGVEVFW
jgi:hypothetical protein